MDAALALALLGFAAATLWPLPGAPSGDAHWVSLADLLRNLALLMPAGVAAALRGWPARRVAAAALVLAAAVEAAQIGIPGRDASLADVAANALGAWLAAAATASAPRWLRPSPPAALAALGALAGIALASGPLLLPAPGSGRLFAHLDPVLGHLEPYGGSVDRVVVSGHAIARGEVPDPDRMRSALAGDFRVAVEGRAGLPPGGQAALFLVTDAEGVTQLLLGPAGSDLVLRYRAPGVELGLEDVRVRSVRAFAGAVPGDPLRVEAHRSGADLCLAVDEEARCGLGASVADGWQRLFSGPAVIERGRPLLGAVWLALLALPLGLFAAPQGAGLAIYAAGLAVLALLPPLTGLSATPPLAVLGAALGLACGSLLAHSVATAKLRP